MNDFLRDHFGYYARKNLRRDAAVVHGLLTKPNLYFRMPKVASGTITAAVSSTTVVLPHAYHPERVRRILWLKSGAFRFTFVRHPFTRFASAYKWLTDRKEGGQLNRYDARQLAVIQRYADINRFCCALPDVLAQNNTLMVHFYPQSQYIYAAQQPLVDFVGKYESLEADCRRLQALHGYALPVTFGPNQKNSHKSALQQPADALESLGLTTRGLESLSRLYADDFRLFNYAVSDTS